MRSQKWITYLTNGATYFVLTFFALIMVFPFIFMLFTSLKEPKDTFNYPPRLLPRVQETIALEGYEEPLPLYQLGADGNEQPFALVESNIRSGTFVDPEAPGEPLQLPMSVAEPRGGFTNQEMIVVDGEELPLYDVIVDGETLTLAQVSQTALGRFVNPDDVTQEQLANVRLSQPVESLTARPENYSDVVELQGMDRSLTNTILVTLLVVPGTLTTSVLGGDAFARLRFPERDSLFVFYLGTIMTGNTENHVLTLSLNVLRGRASDSPNLILAGAAIAVLPPMILYILGQRFFVESATGSGVKG